MFYHRFLFVIINNTKIDKDSFSATGRKLLTVKDMDKHTVGTRTSTDN